MAKLQIKDLTPEVLEEISKLENEQAIKDYFAAKGFDVSDNLAKTLKEHADKGGEELTEEELEKVSGGCGKDSKNGSIS
ncbi:MAG: hypothetical protein II721_06690 [Bacilli bacterium]|nr:hypothetical protein [Bacilli bacterium]